MAQKNESGYKVPQSAATFAEALNLLQEFREKLWEAYNRGYGEWDGFYTPEGKQASQREIEQKVLDGVLEPVQEFFKERLAEEAIIGSPRS